MSDPLTMADVPALFRPLLNEVVLVRDFIRGEAITKTDGDVDKILCLVSGKAEVVAGYSAAQEIILENLEPGDVFGDLSFLTGRSWPSDAALVALEPSTVFEIPMDSFQRVLRENPEFTVALLKSVGKKMVRVDRSDFTSPSRVQGGESTGVCNYPAHPGLTESVQDRFRSLALSGQSIIIVGENGVGKEILAYAFFDASDSHNDVLVPLDAKRVGVESFPSDIRKNRDHLKQISSLDEIRFLFGTKVVDGQGTGKSIPGFLELARDGTLFIRGIDCLAAITQQKLLDALKTGHYCPLEGKSIVQVDFRLLCTTVIDPKHCDPDRHPFIYEFRDNCLLAPPLRDRRSLIPHLAKHYLDHYANEMERATPELDDLTLKAMIDYSWPGNDLELANAMRRAVLVNPGGIVRRQDLTLESRRADSRTRYNLLKLGAVRQAFLSPLFPAVLQSAFIPIFIGIVLMLFLGPPSPEKNPAAVLMWSLAWPGLIICAFLGARISCSFCAIGALSSLAKRIVALEIPFPEVLKMRSDFLIAGGILFIIWIECATDIRSSPFNLGLLLVSMFVLAFALNTIWSRQAWCRYICPLGGVTGLLARTSMLELRADHEICLSNCTSQECYFGTDKTEGCPFGQVVATLHSNQFCKICGSCAKNCSHDAIRLNLRIPGYELGEVRYVRTGTGFLVLGLIGGLLSDILTRIPWFNDLTGWVPGTFMARFTVVFVGIIVLVNLMSMVAAALSYRFFKERFSENYSRFALSMLPLTCMGLLAFHMYYFLRLIPELFVLIRQYFGIETALGVSGTAISTGSIFFMQVVLIIIGLLWTLITMYRLGRSTPRGLYAGMSGVTPHALVSLLIAAAFIMTLKSAFMT